MVYFQRMKQASDWTVIVGLIINFSILALALIGIWTAVKWVSGR